VDDEGGYVRGKTEAKAREKRGVKVGGKTVLTVRGSQGKRRGR
jgi:hypothetical protein